ncbi:DNA/RNA nuclease SfsA [Thermosipho ferrireducens]|uniref:Sugar fermentation stimulation protein homolog n=1 Tax=Thermosipho ferrireducens TaxID=2571116 RepID=A0ABX7S8V8_9BACT|nr:DNA/RNA nuclease SfsA [Thermosipho ferrireducens]QTA37741.1 DNA/RNA nuclease SfsA [Thermosipho ferrireducens]
MSEKILHIPYDYRGTFIKRLNKFVGVVSINNKEELVHIHDPGRLQELLFPGNYVVVKHINNSKRKTKYDLVAAVKEKNWIIVNSSYHRKIAEYILNSPKISPLKKIKFVKAEQMFGNSRLDFYVETDSKKIWIEVKGCTLSRDKIALFPDAPTRRGTKHIEELIHAKSSGFSAALLILIFAPARCFKPNIETDRRFAETFVNALDNGIEVYAIQLEYQIKTQNLMFKTFLPLCL